MRGWDIVQPRLVCAHIDINSLRSSPPHSYVAADPTQHPLNWDIFDCVTHSAATQLWLLAHSALAQCRHM